MTTLNTQTYAGQPNQQRQFYDLQLLMRAEEVLVHNQFGKESDIPLNKGQAIQWRRWEPLSPATTALSEGVTPDGTALNIAKVEATLSQYGAYVALSDKFQDSAIDPVVVETIDVIGQQAGETLDIITRDILNGGTNVQYSDGSVSARYLLVGGDSTLANNDYMSWDAVVNAVTTLKRNKAKAIREIKVMSEMSGGGSTDMFDMSLNDTMKAGLGNYTKRLEKPCYWGILHPDISADLHKYDSDWNDANDYDTSNKAIGEVGMIYGARFVESTLAKIFVAEDLLAASRTIGSAGTWSTKTFTADEEITAQDAIDLVGRKLYIDDGSVVEQLTVASAVAGGAGSGTVTVVETPGTTIDANDVFYPGEAGAEGRQVYSTLLLGMEAYGTVKLAGRGIETIIKQLGSGGTEDPLNQRSTVGWKAYHTAKILNDLWMVRIETTSTEESGS